MCAAHFGCQLLGMSGDVGFGGAGVGEGGRHAGGDGALRFAGDGEPEIAAHAQELSPEVRRAHIALYVNAYSLDVGPDGEAAVGRLLGEAAAIGLVPPLPLDPFVPAAS